MSNLVHQPNYLIAQLPEQFKNDPEAIQACYQMAGNEALVAQYLKWCDQQKGLRQQVTVEPIYDAQIMPNYYQQPPQYQPAPIVYQQPAPPPQIIYVQMPAPEPQPQYSPPSPPVVHQTHITKVYEGGSGHVFTDQVAFLLLTLFICSLLAIAVENRPVVIQQRPQQEVIYP